MSLKNSLFKLYFAPRMRAIDRFRRHPQEAQQKMFQKLIAKGRKTAFGAEHHLEGVKSWEEFTKAVPTYNYDSFKPYIERMQAGEKDVTAAGRITLFAKSSGTTSDRSKYIPITHESVYWNHTLGMRDVATVYSDTHPATKVFDGKTLTLGGSCCVENGYLVGDLSAVLIKVMNFWGGWFRAPKTDTAIIPDFYEKVEAICKECVNQKITSFAGVPSWNLEMMHKVLEYTGKKNLLEVWPDLEFFAHGGVEFTPYRQSFKELIPSEEMHYMETYNASEGFFALADDPAKDDMLLMLDYGTFYEFRDGDLIVPLSGVEKGKAYAMIITSNNGLWRYEIGDRVEFTSVDPYRIRFAGRTKQYINVFGEELIVDNADNAIAEACRKTGAVVAEYSVAPLYMSIDKRGAHEWIVEFEREPQSMESFAEELDNALRRINSDYDAKRKTTLERQHLCVAPKGHFLDWMRARHKNKVPRLMNDRSRQDDIRAFGKGVKEFI